MYTPGRNFDHSQSLHTSVPEHVTHDFEARMGFYEPAVDSLLQDLLVANDAGRSMQEVDGFLGAGNDKAAYVRTAPDGHDVVIKVLHRSTQGRSVPVEQATVRQAAPLIAGADVPGLEKLLAVDTRRGLLVSSLVPGTRMDKMSVAHILRIKKSHLHNVSMTLDAMKSHGLTYHNIGGVFYDKKSGFGFADYDFATVHDHIDDIEDFLRYTLRDFAKIDTALALREQGLNVSAADYETTGLRALARAAVIKRFRDL